MNSINGITNQHQSLALANERTKTPAAAQSQFANVLKNALENVNHLQVQSDQATEALAKGQVNDLHQVMITAQKASIALETTVQIQRKMIDAYNEVMRMQV